MSYWTAHYSTFCPGQDYSGVLSYIQSRTAFAKSTINNAGGNTPFAVSGGNSITTSSNLVTLAGSAPVQVATIKINGEQLPITWTSISAWSLRVPVSSATSVLTIQPFDLAGNLISNLVTSVTVNYTGPIESPQGKVVLNEIMYNPPVPGASFVELFNASSRFTFDLSGWRFHGLDYTFPSGAFLAPGAFLVLAKDSSAFASTYGVSVPVFDQFNGNLQTDGETLT